MGLSQWWRHRTASKVERPSPMVLDLAAGSFGGLRLGDDEAMVLAQLGAPASYARATRRGEWLYPRWGLKVELDHGRVACLAVAVEPEAAFGFDGAGAGLAPYAGALVLEVGGRELAARDVKEEAVRRLYGEPHDDDLDEDGELYSSFDGGGRLRIFVFVQQSGRMLAHAEVGVP